MSRFLTLALGLASLGFLAAAPADEAGKKDLDQLQGAWTLDKQTRDGKEMPADTIKRISRVVKGNVFTITIDGDEGKQEVKAEFKLDSAKNPKEMDVEFKGGEVDGQSLKAIYEVDGDTMKTCYGQPGAERPKKFEAGEGTGLTISVWKKAKKKDDK